MNWLLPTQTLLDLIAAQATPAQAWAAEVDTRSLRTSVIAVQMAQMGIDQISHPGRRLRLMEDLSRLLDAIAADSGVMPLDFSAAHARIWAHLALTPELGTLPQVDRQVYATAIYEGLTVVEGRRAETDALRNAGLRIHIL
ncbi:hypothetical protein D3C78_938380 [compost metagenome]